jgi:ribonuclease HI
MELIIHTDGGARGNPGPAAVGIFYEAGDWFETFEQYIGETTNNVAEYTAVKMALQEWPRLQLSHQLEIDRISFKLDSQLVVMQLLGKYKVKEPGLQVLCREVLGLLVGLGVPYAFTHVPRAENTRADKLVNHALDTRV